MTNVIPLRTEGKTFKVAGWTGREFLYVLSFKIARRIMMPVFDVTSTKSNANNLYDQSIGFTETDDGTHVIGGWYQYGTDKETLSTLIEKIPFSDGSVKYSIRNGEVRYHDKINPKKNRPHSKLIQCLLERNEQSETYSETFNDSWDIVETLEVTGHRKAHILLTQMVFSHHLKFCDKILSDWDTWHHTMTSSCTNLPSSFDVQFLDHLRTTYHSDSLSNISDYVNYEFSLSQEVI